MLVQAWFLLFEGSVLCLGCACYAIECYVLVACGKMFGLARELSYNILTFLSPLQGGWWLDAELGKQDVERRTGGMGQCVISFSYCFVWLQ